MMTDTPHGPGRTLPASSTTQAGFLQETTDQSAPTGVEFVNAADVLAALSEIDAADETAAANNFTGLVTASITQATTAKSGGTYIATAACTVTLPAAAVAFAINNASLRRVTVINNMASGTVTVAPAAGTINGSATDTALSSRYTSGKYETDGTNWFKV